MWINNPYGEEGKGDLTRRKKNSKEEKEEKDLEKYTTTKQNSQPQYAKTPISNGFHLDFFFHVRLSPLGTQVPSLNLSFRASRYQFTK